MTAEQQRIADGLELLLNAANMRVRASVYGVEQKCNVNGKGYLTEGEDLCVVATNAAKDVLAAVSEYRATAIQLAAFRIANVIDDKAGR